MYAVPHYSLTYRLVSKLPSARLPSSVRSTVNPGARMPFPMLPPIWLAFPSRLPSVVFGLDALDLGPNRLGAS